MHTPRQAFKTKNLGSRKVEYETRKLDPTVKKLTGNIRIGISFAYPFPGAVHHDRVAGYVPSFFVKLSPSDPKVIPK